MSCFSLKGEHVLCLFILVDLINSVTSNEVQGSIDWYVLNKCVIVAVITVIANGKTNRKAGQLSVKHLYLVMGSDLSQLLVSWARRWR